MGGLSAILRSEQAAVPVDCLLRMAAAAPHRGRHPATHVAGPVMLAHQASSASVPEPQPFTTDDGRISVVLTGRLYNREEVVSELRAARRPQGNGSHCGTIAAAYDAWGADCLVRLDGDFAFVLYDAAHRRLLGARDAVGVKPLCWGERNGILYLASEPAQIIAAGVPNTPCALSIASYIALERSMLDPGLSFHEHVRRLRPGHRLVKEAAGPAREERYWQIDPARINPETTEADMAARVRSLLEEAVRRRMPREAPYGCALSGGFDSSTVAALLRRELDRQGIHDRLETFSFELRDPDADEPELIEAVAREVRADHHRVYVDKDDAFTVLPQILRAGGQPQIDMGLLYLWRKKEETARQGVHVTMSGLGGDELFFGRYHYLADLLRTGRLMEFAREMRSLFPVDRSTGKPTSLKRLAAAYIVSPLMPRPARRLLRKVQGRSVVPPWIEPSFARGVDLAGRIEQGPSRLYPDCYRQDCFEVFESILVNVTLPIHEALGAAFDVDTRFPLLDRRLIEYMFAVPRRHKIREGQTRILQRRAMDGILPPVVTQEHLKKNMNPVLWRQQEANLRRALKPLMQESDHRIAAYMRMDWIRDAYRRFEGGRASPRDGYVLWYALNLESWLRSLEDRQEMRDVHAPAA